MKNDILFAHAVTLASAFIANGDIRCGGNTNENTAAMDMIGDMVTSIYRTLERTQVQLESEG